MSEVTLDPIGQVFAKTPRGRAEIVHRSAGLNVKQRSLLIMIDGRTPLRAMPLPPAEVRPIIERLLELNLVAATEDLAAQPGLLSSARPQATSAGFPASRAEAGRLQIGEPNAAAPAPAESLASADPHLDHIKSLMVDSAHASLGLMAAELIRQIAQARDTADLQAVAGHWHMALCESKRGRELASAHIDEVKRALNASVMTSPGHAPIPA